MVQEKALCREAKTAYKVVETCLTLIHQAIKVSTLRIYRVVRRLQIEEP